MNLIYVFDVAMYLYFSHHSIFFFYRYFFNQLLTIYELDRLEARKCN